MGRESKPQGSSATTPTAEPAVYTGCAPTPFPQAPVPTVTSVDCITSPAAPHANDADRHQRERQAVSSTSPASTEVVKRKVSKLFHLLGLLRVMKQRRGKPNDHNGQ
jgi:hypothetical protein